MIVNDSLFRLINDAHSPAGDAVFGIVSGLGDGLVVALVCTLLMLFRLHLGGAALAAFAVSGLIAQLLKRIFDLPRPPAVLTNVHVLGDTLTSHSFPSGHATSCGVMVLLAFLIWKRNDWRAWVVSGLFLLAAYGRIYGGVHFPLDVMAGLIIGMATMWAFWQWSKYWPVKGWESSPWAWKLPGLALVIEADVLAIGYHIQPSTAQPLRLILPIAALLILAKVWKEKIGQ
ncbi:MAG: phosphatase PAP2 family protein [Mariprofundaceae bacterium]|nr:phosphatase PAP2 family protein [Mariprofundaceae bacterium]